MRPVTPARSTSPHLLGRDDGTRRGPGREAYRPPSALRA